MDVIDGPLGNDEFFEKPRGNSIKSFVNLRRCDFLFRERIELRLKISIAFDRSAGNGGEKYGE